MSEIRVKTGPTRVEASGPAGVVRAVVATLNTKDLGGDVATADTFTDGEEVVISSYNHSTMVGHLLPVGKGVIHVEGAEVILVGQYFMANASARESFEVVRQMGASQEWSYGYRIHDQRPTKINGEPANLLVKVSVFEASHVIRGQGINTRTVDAKEETLREYLRFIRDRWCPDPVPAAARTVQVDLIRERLRFERQRFLAIT
jgi:hypothetical protein